MRIDKFICDKCSKEIDINEWLYSITGDIINICASEKRGRLVLKQGHYCEKCYKSLMKKGIE